MEQQEIHKTFHEHQWKVLEARQSFVAAIAGVQSGKTMVGAAWLAKRISDFPTKDHLIAAPTYKLLQQSTLKKFFQEFPFFRQFYSIANSVIDLPEGGKVYIRSTEDPYGLEGMTIKSAWLDEGGQMKADTWTVIQARVAIERGQVLITTTPYNMGWLYGDFYKHWQAGDPNFLVVNWNSQQNPYFPKEEFDRIRKTMDATTFDMRYMGTFRKRHGLVYPDFNETMIADMDKKPAFTAVIGGIDWGFTNPSAVVVLGVDSDNHYWLMDEWYERGKTTDEIVHKALQLQAQYRVNVWYADPAEPDRIEQAKRNGLYVREANKDVKLGIDVVRQVIREKRLKVKRGLIHFIDEIENYHYPEDGQPGFQKDLPMKEDDHLMDAFRYAVFTHRPYHDGNLLQRVGENRSRKYQFT